MFERKDDPICGGALSSSPAPFWPKEGGRKDEEEDPEAEGVFRVPILLPSPPSPSTPLVSGLQGNGPSNPSVVWERRTDQ